MITYLIIAGILTVSLLYAREYVQYEIGCCTNDFLKEPENIDIAKKAAKYIDAAKFIFVANYCMYLFWVIVVCFVITKVLTWT
jgi:hypothetical protein